jgi:hypothetical protein
MSAMRFLSVLLLTLGLGGCGALSEYRKESALEATLSQYRAAMRWGHWDTLMGVRAPEAPAVPALDRDNIRVTSYEVRQPPVPVGEDQVRQVVEIEYVLADRQRVRKLYDNQEWRHDAQRKAWLLYSPFPDFR